MTPALDPRDRLLFEEVKSAMERVARRYELKLYDVVPNPDPTSREGRERGRAAADRVVLSRGLEGGHPSRLQLGDGR